MQNQCRAHNDFINKDCFLAMVKIQFIIIIFLNDYRILFSTHSYPCFQPSQHYSSSAPGLSTTSSSTPQPAHLASDDTPCPPHVMAQVWVRNNRGMQDSKSLDEISQACGGSFFVTVWIKSFQMFASFCNFRCCCPFFFPQVGREPEEVPEVASQRAEGPRSPQLWNWRGR